MNITIRVDTTALTAAMSDLAKKQVPFALARTLNNVLIDAQSETIRTVRRGFVVRREDFLRRTVKMVQFASKNAPTAVLAITGPGGDIYAKHEAGGRKLPRGRSLALPQQARRTKRDIISKANRPAAFGLQPHGTSGRVLRGAKRTFAIRNADGTGALFQRTGRGKRSLVRTLYTFTPSAGISARRFFGPTVVDAFETRFDRHFEINFAAAMRSAR
jgi:hypothetical protein